MVWSNIQANDLYTYHSVALPPRNQNLLDICIPIYAFSQDMIRSPLVQWNDSLFCCVPTGSLLRAYPHTYYNRCQFIPGMCTPYGVLYKGFVWCRAQLLLWYGVREYERSTESNIQSRRWVHSASSVHTLHTKVRVVDCKYFPSICSHFSSRLCQTQFPLTTP